MHHPCLFLETFSNSCGEAEAVPDQCKATAPDTLHGQQGSKATEGATAEQATEGNKGFGSSGASDSIGSRENRQDGSRWQGLAMDPLPIYCPAAGV